MMDFEFSTASRIIFGTGSLQNIGNNILDLGDTALVITNLKLEIAQKLFEQLNRSGISFLSISVNGEPTVDSIREGVAIARKEKYKLVIGIGGGSAIDTGKAIAALAVNKGEVLDYLEVIGKGKSLLNLSLPFIAIPTTAGTGSEVTRNAVIGSPEQAVKVSLRSPAMLPKLALVDPELTFSVPPQVTATTGLDAITQLIEPYVSNMANPVTDSLCIEGLTRAARSIQVAYENGEDLSARQDMCLASLFSGMALANARLGAVHGFAAPLGGMYSAPHGAICARLLPIVFEVNLRAMKARDPKNPSLSRFEEIGKLLTRIQGSSAIDGASWLAEKVEALNITGLAIFGLQVKHFPDLIEKAMKASSMEGNPIKLDYSELYEILERSL